MKIRSEKHLHPNGKICENELGYHTIVADLTLLTYIFDRQLSSGRRLPVRDLISLEGYVSDYNSERYTQYCGYKRVICNWLLRIWKKRTLVKILERGDNNG